MPYVMQMKWVWFQLVQVLYVLMVTAQVIALDPSSPLGYERKHEALRGAGYYEDAIASFETMLSKMAESSDPAIRGEGIHITLIFIGDLS